MKQFNSFGSFAAHLAKVAATGHEVTHHMVKAGTEEIQKTAQGIIGEYQGAIGPYPAWQELAESTQAERARLGYSENDPGYRSGEMQKSVQSAVEGNEGAVGSNDQNLVWFDLGTTKQPPRPVLGAAAIHSSPRILAQFGKTTFAWLAGMGWKRTQFLRK